MFLRGGAAQVFAPEYVIVLTCPSCMYRNISGVCVVATKERRALEVFIKVDAR